MESAKSPVLDVTEEQFDQTLRSILYVVDEFRKILFDETVADPFMKMKQLYAVIDTLPRMEERLAATHILLTLFVQCSRLAHESAVIVVSRREAEDPKVFDSDKDRKKFN